jgi:type II secretory pathway pseudopilin PulG
MNKPMNLLTRLLDQRGITVAEVLAAAAILGLGIAALISVVPVAGHAVQDGNQTSTATYLAQQRLEQVRNATATTDCVGLSAAAAAAPGPSPAGTCAAGVNVTFADEPLNSLPGFGQYARSVRIRDCGDVANLAACGNVTSSAVRLVIVTVTYRPTSAAGVSNVNTSVNLEWLVAQRL